MAAHRAHARAALVATCALSLHAASARALHAPANSRIDSPEDSLLDSPADSPDTPEVLLEDFVHYVLVADREFAAALAEQLLQVELSDAALARMVDDSPALARRYERAVAAAQKLPGVAPLAHRLDQRIRNGRHQLEQGNRLLTASLHELAQEARSAQKDGTLPRSTADLVRTIGGPVPPELVARQMISPQHHDDFVDAYVRWQLTSLGPALPAMDDSRFRRLLDELPGLVPNPRADRALVDRFAAAQRAGRLNDTDLRRANDLLNELEERSAAAARLNLPALGVRDWLELRLADDPDRLALARLERCQAMIEAGWPVESLKTRLKEHFEASAGDMAFEHSERRAVAQQAERLAGRRVPLIASARIVDGSFSVAFDEAAVYDFDVRAWIKALMPDDSTQDPRP